MMQANNQRAIRLALPKRLLLAAFCMAYGSSAVAAAATGVMTVSATVASTCLVGTSTLAFGNISSAAIQLGGSSLGNLDNTGTVTVNCTKGSSYTISLGVGGGAGATFAIRKMTSGGTLLNYSIYTTGALTTVWGDGTLASETVPRIGSGTNQTITTYGRIFSGQTVPAGAYTDTVAVTVTY